MNATNIIIYAQMILQNFYFLVKIRVLQTYLPQNESRRRDSDGSEKKLGNFTFDSSSISQVASSLV
jgi:hypothetical protein